MYYQNNILIRVYNYQYIHFWDCIHQAKITFTSFAPFTPLLPRHHFSLLSPPNSSALAAGLRWTACGWWWEVGGDLLSSVLCLLRHYPVSASLTRPRMPRRTLAAPCLKCESHHRPDGYGAVRHWEISDLDLSAFVFIRKWTFRPGLIDLNTFE